MIPETQENSDDFGFAELQELTWELCDDLGDLKIYFHLISAAYLSEEEPSLRPENYKTYTAEDALDKVQFLLARFTDRFTFKEIKQMSQKAERLHILISTLDLGGKKS